MHPSSSAETFRCLADNAKCNIMVVEDDELLQSILKVADDLPHLKAIIQYRGKPKDGHKKVYSVGILSFEKKKFMMELLKMY